MGQKTNPNIFRLGINKTWKTDFLEKKNQELPNYLFKDLEIKKFLERSFELYGLLLHNYKIQYSNSVINIYVSYFITPTFSFNKKVNDNKIQIRTKKGTKRFISLDKYYKSTFNKALKTDRLKDLQNVNRKNKFFTTKNLNNLKKYLEFKTNSKNEIGRSISKSSSRQQNLHDLKLHNKLTIILKGLSLFVNKRYHIVTTFESINNKINLTEKQAQLFKKKVIFLQKFRNASFFKEGLDVLFITVHQKNCAHLVVKFIANQIKKTKRHNFLLAFLKRTLTLFIHSNFSKIAGIKIIVKGRLNGTPRARHKSLIIGNVPVQTIHKNIDYSQLTVHNASGSYGIKVWIVDKL